MLQGFSTAPCVIEYFVTDSLKPRQLSSQSPNQPPLQALPGIKLSGFKPDTLIESLPEPVQVYVVGGAVRDELLGRPQSDRDWVLVGASPEDLLALGFRPVGADFPVFLHPHTQEEYALARTERKSGHGYKGFVFHASPDVTLQQDLERRDFTVNAMAMSADGALYDPFGGYSDLNAGVMRHVSAAFAEDPLRILRLARFLARFTTFTVAQGTLALCQQLVDDGEVSHLVPERTFAELNKGMAEPMPSRMIQLLMKLGAWTILLGKNGNNSALLNLNFDGFTRLDSIVGGELAQDDSRWVFLLGGFESIAEISRLGQALRMPSQLIDQAKVAAHVAYFARNSCLGRQSVDITVVDAFLDLFSKVDIYRKPDRLLGVLEVLGQFLQADSHCQVFKYLRLAARDQLNGQYKADLRRYMDANQGVAPVQLVAQFKSDWLVRLLNT